MTKRTPWYPVLVLTALFAVLLCRPAQAANTMKDVRQLVLVTTSSKSSSYAAVTAYERSSESGKWVSKQKTDKGRVGWSGIQPIASRRQGTGKTPQGILRLTRAMGVRSDPGAKFSYTKITNANLS